MPETEEPIDVDEDFDAELEGIDDGEQELQENEDAGEDKDGLH